MKKIILSTIICMSMYISASAAELEFTDTPVYPIDAMNRLGSISVAEGENTINLSCDSVSDASEEYFISIYEKSESVDAAHYVVKYLGPINLKNFKIAGLDGGKDYYVLMSSVGNKQTVSGKVFTSYTEVSSK